MSGRTKRILYAIVTIFGHLAALAAAVLACYFSTPRNMLVLGIFGIFYALLPLNVFIHELGHIFFCLIMGMRLEGVKVGRFLFYREKGKLKFRFSAWGNTAGECAICPKSERGVRGKFLAATLGGVIFNFLYAAVFFPLYFLLPQYPVLLFFEAFAPLSLLEGIAAILPVELTAGKTDGLVALGLIRGTAEEEIALRVLMAQGILYKKSFSEVPHELLFDAPTVREDLTSLHALELMCMQSLLWEGKKDEAWGILQKATSSDELFEEEKGEFERYRTAFSGGFVREKCPLHGVELLEEKLEQEAGK